MHWFVVLFAVASVCSAQHVLVACASSTKNYVVGAKLPPSGLFLKSKDGEWRHAGYNHPWLLGVTGSAGELFVAGGSGLIRVRGGEQWRILTGGDVTELRDVDAGHGAIYFAHSAGIRVTRDGGSTWEELSAGLRRKYTEAIRVHPRDAQVLVAGGEEGLFHSADGGKTWQLAGAAGHQVLRIEVSPHDPCFWLAGTEGGGLFLSRDCGRTFENQGNVAVGHNLYGIAFDERLRGRIAIAAWGSGVAVSEDGGKTWVNRTAGLPGNEVTSVAFDPAKAGRLFAAVHDRGVFRSEDSGATWAKDGLDSTHVNRLRFVPEEQQR